MLRPASLAFVGALAFAFALPACRYGRAGANAVGSLFSSPAPVAKNRHPVAADARLAVIWVGHATALVQIDDKVILTDPVFSSSVGQVSKRVIEPGIDPKDLPPIDAVLVSHMHYDHLSLGSLETIEKKVRACFLPRGGTTYLTDFGFPAYELGPWQNWEKNGLRVTAAPVDHVGFRYGIDDAWMPDSFTGYVVEYHGLKVYFGGDTAYDQRLFVETGQRFPGIDLALLPIAPIEPRDFMRRFHMDPREAVQAFVDLGAERMVPIHFDTFISSTDRPGDALRELDRATHRWNLGSRSVVPLAVGQRRVFLKPGEEPTRSRTSPAVPTSGETRPATTPTPTPTSTMPDEDKFDD